MLSAHPAVPLSAIQIDPNNRRLSLHTASGHIFNTVHDGLPSPGTLTPVTAESGEGASTRGTTPSSGSPARGEPPHLFGGDSGDEQSSPGTPGEGGYEGHHPRPSHHHQQAGKQYYNHAGGPRQEELSRRMRMVDLSRLEAERQARGEGHDDDDDGDGEDGGIDEGGRMKTFGNGESRGGADSPVTPVPVPVPAPVGGEDALTQDGRMRSGRSQSEQGQARAPLVGPLPPLLLPRIPSQMINQPGSLVETLGLGTVRRPARDPTPSACHADETPSPCGPTNHTGHPAHKFHPTGLTVPKIIDIRSTKQLASE